MNWDNWTYAFIWTIRKAHSSFFENSNYIKILECTQFSTSVFAIYTCLYSIPIQYIPYLDYISWHTTEKIFVALLHTCICFSFIYCTLIRPLNVSFICFTVMSGLFKADYAVWAIFIVETIWCTITVNAVIIWSFV